MIFTETKMNLFDVDENYYLAHCISSDFALGAGIAKEFRTRGVAKTLENCYPKFYWHNKGYCLYTPMEGCKGVYNLVTKENYWGKPTYNTLISALVDLKKQILQNRSVFGEIKLAMPMIGCGLDKLEWVRVKEIICDLFSDTDIEITICYL